MSPGVVSIIIRKSDGRVLGIGASFDLDRPGGFSVRETQNRRARELACMDFVKRQCSDLVGQNMELFECEKLVLALCDRELVTLETEAIGYED